MYAENIEKINFFFQVSIFRHFPFLSIFCMQFPYSFIKSWE